MLDANFDNSALLNRICEVYGFTQKIQLANHFKIAASSLQNRYTRGNLSYDLAVLCALETGADIKWLMTGEGKRGHSSEESNTLAQLNKFTLSEGRLTEVGILHIDYGLFGRLLKNALCVMSESKSYIVEKEASLADGLWLVDVESSVSLRELTVLPGKKLHVAGGKIAFECSMDEIKMLGRVIGVYSEVA
ncbi:transcriptional repressor [Erwinia phage ENT90]|uniref:CI repressor protein n=2 Tax=root TaxID=1 RepID=F1BUS8_9CAUD|nr:phage repressor protein CI [Mixta calida]YP_007238049.1 transcriptional repressor [Erwinia phage ENT90]AIX72478.1 repressor [Pantoea sp. PSNIH2]POU52306.1 phage repressor protein CI [Pantoea sp. PSNIH5]POU69804.1 phage repressor protein CI [Pantoea sp. PSNIH4]POY65475.1 phage repressor protein CI [Pantoea sp. PSNIH3]ADX32424.1 CI repressor protein [Erwinia phage ENT90]